MDPRERMNNINLGVSAMIESRLSNVWTALPVQIVAFDHTLRTAQVRSMIIPQWRNPVTGVLSPLPMPVIADCPVCFPGGGGFQLTFPLQPGDEALLILSSRCIDAWWSTGKPNVPTDFRMHDLSDGFVIPGVMSKPTAVASYPVDSTRVQLRSANDDTAVSFGSAGMEIYCPNNITVLSSSSITLDAPAGTISANGNVLG